MEGTVGLVENELVGTTKKYRDGLAFIGAASDFNDLVGSTSADFFNKVGFAQLISFELVNVSNWSCTDGSTDEINVASVDVSDDHDLLLGQEVEGKVTHSLS